MYMIPSGRPIKILAAGATVAGLTKLGTTPSGGGTVGIMDSIVAGSWMDPFNREGGISILHQSGLARGQ